MTIEATFNSLLGNFGALRESLQNLRLTVVEDRPLREGVVIVDRMGDAIDDLSGWLEEGSEGARQAAKAANYPFDGPRAIQGLRDASTRFVRIREKFFFGLASYPQVADLIRLGKSRGREWRAWSGSVKEALDQTGRAISELDQVLLGAWQELAERVSASSVSVRTTNIGQQISTANAETGKARLGTPEQSRDRMT